MAAGPGNRRDRRAASRPARPVVGRPDRIRPAPAQPTDLGSRYGVVVHRGALAPGLLGAIGLLAGLALFDTKSFVIILYATAILALIVAVFAYQAKHWWWIPVLAAMAVLWNPIYPIPFDGRVWQLAQIAGAAVFVAAAVTVKQIDRGSNRG